MCKNLCDIKYQKSLSKFAFFKKLITIEVLFNL